MPRWVPLAQCDLRIYVSDAFMPIEFAGTDRPRDGRGMASMAGAWHQQQNWMAKQSSHASISRPKTNAAVATLLRILSLLATFGFRDTSPVQRNTWRGGGFSGTGTKLRGKLKASASSVHSSQTPAAAQRAVESANLVPREAPAALRRMLAAS